MVQLWDGSTTDPADDLNSSLTFRAKVVITLGSHLLLAADQNGADTERRAIMWSVAGDPTDFGAATGGTDTSNGTAYVYEGTGSIIGMKLLTRDTIGVYKTDSVHLLEYVGAPTYFVVRSSLVGIGVESNNSIAPIGNEHIVLTTNGLRKYDGSNFTPFAPEIDSVLSQYYPNNNSRYVSLLYDGFYNKLWIFLPEAGTSFYSKSALVYSFRDASWARQTGFQAYAACFASIPSTTGTTWGDMGMSWAAAANMTWGGQSLSTRYKLLLGDETDGVYSEDANVATRHGVAFTSTVETMMYNPGLILFQSPTWNTEVVQVDIGRVSGNPNVYIGVSDRGDESITWRGPYTPDVNGRVYITIVGRWFIFRLQSDTAFTVYAVTPWFVKRGVV